MDDDFSLETASRLDNVEQSDPDELVGIVGLTTDPAINAAIAANAGIYRAVVEKVRSWGYQFRVRTGAYGTSASMSLAKIVPPAGVCVHHTAGNSTPTDYIANGDPGRGLAGPLANIHSLRDGTGELLGVAYQNHAGGNDKTRYDRIVAGVAPLDRDLIPGADGSFSANRWLAAIEANGDGGLDDFTEPQRRFVTAVCAAFHLVCGWPVEGLSPRVGAHKELTRRKPGDPAMSMGQLRKDVAAFLQAPYGPGGPIVIPPPVEPPAPTTPPPEPTTGVAVQFRLGVANLQLPRFGGSLDFLGRGKSLATLRVSVLCLQETDEAMRSAIRRILGDTWKVLVAGGDSGSTCVLWDSSKWDHRTPRSVSFGTSLHGAIAVPLVRRGSGRGIDVMSIHVRPQSIATTAEKRADLRKALTLAGSWPMVIAGDFAQSQPALGPGWRRATPGLDTYDPPGIQAVDAVWVRGLVTRGAELTNPGGLSDHKWWAAKLTIPSTDGGNL